MAQYRDVEGMRKIEIKAVTIDYWETLYFHVGTSEYRKQVRNRALMSYLDSRRTNDLTYVCETFFQTVDSFIKSTWSKGVCPTSKETMRYAYDFYKGKVSEELLENLLEVTFNVYKKELHPRLAPSAISFLEWVTVRWPLYLVSDTFTLTGRVLDEIMSQDGIIDFFTHRFYSDEIMVKKPDPTVMEKISSEEQIKTSEIIHVGDLIETDAEFARCAGSKCIIVNGKSDDIRSSLLGYPEDVILAFCKNLDEVKETLRVQ